MRCGPRAARNFHGSSQELPAELCSATRHLRLFHNTGRGENHGKRGLSDPGLSLAARELNSSETAAMDSRLHQDDEDADPIGAAAAVDAPANVAGPAPALGVTPPNPPNDAIVAPGANVGGPDAPAPCAPNAPIADAAPSRLQRVGGVIVAAVSGVAKLVGSRAVDQDENKLVQAEPTLSNVTAPEAPPHNPPTLEVTLPILTTPTSKRQGPSAAGGAGSHTSGESTPRALQFESPDVDPLDGADSASVASSGFSANTSVSNSTNLLVSGFREKLREQTDELVVRLPDMLLAPVTGGAHADDTILHGLNAELDKTYEQAVMSMPPEAAAVLTKHVAKCKQRLKSEYNAMVRVLVEEEVARLKPVWQPASRVAAQA